MQIPKPLRPKPVKHPTQHRRQEIRPTTRSDTANIATTGKTYVGAPTRLTDHYRNMPHRDKPEPMISTHS
ncbi:hypothetical protein Bca4012_077335 [Brassica carinata]|uniref:Uncharacterized protein n=1 Tax=Brassica carinata TaxID=52824 RepID=A0A8X7U5P8_BRACI|nr:hypothetical protein Bca52824_072385 [Brassica carinata]